jgi:prepilin-type N-terminal cleavage/methylation domain-containing protein/prepilin-type processing-associated H-X9-DG protein
MNTRKGFTLIELLVVIAIIAVLAAILFPVFAKARKAAQASNCQSNLKQIGAAFKMYLTDNNDTYPTNRGINGVLSNDIQITPTNAPNDASGNPTKFMYGQNWVEDLTGYIESATQASDPMTVWKCQAASNLTWPASPAAGVNAAMVTYAMNYNMVEQPEGIIKGASNLMLAREMDRLVQAVLRPTNVSVANQAAPPNSPFLSTNDTGSVSGTMPGPINTTPHGASSMVLFCDGHVKAFEAALMPNTLTAAKCYDTNLTQWFNFANLPTTNANNESIAVSP